VVADACAEVGARVISTRPYLAAAGLGESSKDELLYGAGAPYHGHLTPLGNRVCFEAMRDGLEGRMDPLDESELRDRAERARAEIHPCLHSTQMILGRSARVSVRSPVSRVRHAPASVALA